MRTQWVGVITLFLKKASLTSFDAPSSAICFSSSLRSSSGSFPDEIAHARGGGQHHRDGHRHLGRDASGGVDLADPLECVPKNLVRAVGVDADLLRPAALGPRHSEDAVGGALGGPRRLVAGGLAVLLVVVRDRLRRALALPAQVYSEALDTAADSLDRLYGIGDGLAHALAHVDHRRPRRLQEDLALGDLLQLAQGRDLLEAARSMPLPWTS